MEQQSSRVTCGWRGLADKQRSKDGDLRSQAVQPLAVIPDEILCLITVSKALAPWGVRTFDVCSSHRNPLNNVACDLLLPAVVEPRRARVTMPSQILHVLQGHPLGQKIRDPLAPGGIPGQMP